MGGGVLDVLAALAVVLAQAMLLAAIPVAYGYAGVALIRLLANRDYWSIPLAIRLGMLAGLMAGAALLIASPIAYLYDPNEIFLDQGYWNIGVGEFLADRANPLAYGFDSLFARLARPHPFDLFDLYVVLTGGLLLFALGLCVAYFRGIDRLRALAATLTAFLWAAYMAVYLIAVLCLLLFKLNFWSIAVAILLIQFFRGRTHARSH